VDWARLGEKVGKAFAGKVNKCILRVDGDTLNYHGWSDRVLANCGLCPRNFDGRLTVVFERGSRLENIKRVVISQEPAYSLWESGQRLNQTTNEPL